MSLSESNLTQYVTDGDGFADGQSEVYVGPSSPHNCLNTQWAFRLRVRTFVCSIIGAHVLSSVIRFSWFDRFCVSRCALFIFVFDLGLSSVVF